jgi:hypothetical protein
MYMYTTDYLSAELLLQRAFMLREGAFGADSFKTRQSREHLLQVYNAQQGSRAAEAAELLSDPRKHAQSLALRIAEMVSVNLTIGEQSLYNMLTCWQ